MSSPSATFKDGDGSSYFSKSTRPVASEPNSPAISPFSYPASAPVRPTRRPRPPVRSHARAKSDEVAGYSRFTVQTIDENEPSGSDSNAPFLTMELVPQGEILQQTSRSVTISQKTSSSLASVKSMVQKFLLATNTDLRQNASRSASPTRSGAVHKRARSESSSSRLKAGFFTSLPRRKTRSAENFSRRGVCASEGSPRLSSSSPITPLRPPLSRTVSHYGPAYHHEIRLETPFTVAHDDFSEVSLKKEPSSSRRTSSIHPRAIFSAPLNIVRKLRRHSNTKIAVPGSSSVSPSSLDMHGSMRQHISQLRRKRTQEALQLVSQVLRLTSGDKADTLPIEPEPKPCSTTLRSMSSKSTSSIKSSKDGKRRPRNPTKRLPILLARRMTTEKSMELDQPRSDTSSIRDLRLGPTPYATPEEYATYKLKRSLSAETEEFLKVDISIRGGTSYLPSEARRIHTPRLPRERNDGKRRGFFFNYNPPGHPACDDERSRGSRNSERESVCWPNSNEDRSVSREVNETFDHKTYRGLRQEPRTRPVEWYDTKLAELDTTSDDGTPELRMANNGGSPKFSDMRRRTARALHKMRERNLGQLHNQEEDAKNLSDGSENHDEDRAESGIDYNIPEHYPNSPLCPANARYWRFVDGKLSKGKDTRTCWMHGEMRK